MGDREGQRAVEMHFGPVSAVLGDLELSRFAVLSHRSTCALGARVSPCLMAFLTCSPQDGNPLSPPVSPPAGALSPHIQFLSVAIFLNAPQSIAAKSNPFPLPWHSVAGSSSSPLRVYTRLSLQ